MSLQIVNTNVEFDFPLQPTGTAPVKEEVVKQISERLWYRVTVFYTVKSHPQQ